jgi:Papain family cysteine protease
MARARKAPARKPAARRRKAGGRQPKRILNCEPSPKQEEDWTYDHAAEADVVDAAPPIPASKDLRAAWWTINDQGTTGSCVGWATADAVLRWHFVQAKKLPENLLLSPRFIWMAAKETDPNITRPTTFIEEEGTSLKTALDIARKFGVVTDQTLPFATGKLYPQDAKTFYAIAATRKILAYFNLDTDLSRWRAWLATKGPILTRLDVDRTWDNASVTGGNLDTYQADKTRGGHAIALVGYTPNRFIVRNSWGKTWGDRGYAYASLSYAQEAFTEAYGVSL